MTLVYNVLTDTSGRQMQSQTVRITLFAPGNQFTSSWEVINRHAVDTGDDGRWVADLIPNAEYEREGTFYRVDQRDGILDDSYVHDIVVPPDDGQEHWLRDLIVIAPEPGEPFPPLPPHALGDHTDVDTSGAIDGQVLQYVAGQWQPGTVSGGGGGGGFYVHFQDVAAAEIQFAHSLGYRPAGVRLFSEDWALEYDEFAVQHQSELALTVTVGQPFRGYVTVS